MASGFNPGGKSRYGRMIKPTEKVREVLKENTARSLYELSTHLNQLECEVRTYMSEKASPDIIMNGHDLWRSVCDAFLSAEADHRRYLLSEELAQHDQRIVDTKQSMALYCGDVKFYVKPPTSSPRPGRASRSVSSEESRLKGEIEQVESRLREMSFDMSRKSSQLPPARGASSTVPPRRSFDRYVSVRPDRTGASLVTVDEEPASCTATKKTRQTTSTPRADAPTMVVPSQSDVRVTSSVSRATSGSDTSEALLRLADILEAKQDRLPRMEPDVFKGDPLQYPIWVNSFDTLIERNTSSATDRLFYLGKYTDGAAKESIVGYLSLFSEDAYLRARQVLKARYGDKVRVAEAYRKKLSAWRAVRKGDGVALQKFADFLWQCHSAISTVRNLSSLNSAEEMNKICGLLPEYVVQKWARVVDNWYYRGDDCGDPDYPVAEEGEYPPFVEMCRLISREARIATGPTAQSAPETTTQSNTGGHSRNSSRRSHSLAIKSAAESTPEASARHGGEQKKFCNYCRGEHWIQECRDFMAKPAEDRRSFALYNSLCFGCLRKSHSFKDCRWKKPELLKDAPAGGQHAPRATSHRVQSAGENEGLFYSMVVPVCVVHPARPDVAVETYALLDTQSDSCFLTEELLEQLQAPRTQVELQLNTIGSSRRVKSNVVPGLVVTGIRMNKEVKLPRCYSRDAIPVDREQIPRPEVVRRWDHLTHVAEQLMPYRDDLPIGLLLGYNCPSALMPRASAQDGEDKPYAVYTSLGWSVMGCIDGGRSTPAGHCLATAARALTMSDFHRALDLDFNEPADPETMMSQDDMLFMQKVRGTIRQREDAHFEMELPFRDDDVTMPNNRRVALKRLMSIRQKMTRDAEFKEQYRKFINGLIDAGHAERAPPDHVPGKINYMPHHGVKHPRKPGEIRGVFDNAAEMQGVSLNSKLLNGPDLTNNLAGVLCRFRQERVAFMCDIKGMFLQVGVPEHQRDFLRFLWFADGDPDGEVVEYRMCVHAFGARSSPSCANKALLETADRYEAVYSQEVADFLRRHFYVDDGLKSMPTDDEAVALFLGGHNMCRSGGFYLHKFTCNSAAALERIPEELLAKNVRDCQAMGCDLPVETSLGLMWELISDSFLFVVGAMVREFTRRGMLAALSSVYDPLGLLSPVLLVGRLILQKLCFLSLAWDAEVPELYRRQWEKWHSSLSDLARLRIPRCFRKATMGELTTVRLHHFSDASSTGYGMCSYVQLIDSAGDMDVRLVMAKARVPPKRPVTIPRMELQAAVLSTKVAAFVKRELDYEDVESFYWCDSQVVLAYIANTEKRFHIYVTNRVQYIRDNSPADSWRYVRSEDNPADIASRGCTPEEIIGSAMWWTGPDFLRASEFPNERGEFEVSADDPEVRKEAVVNKAEVEECLSVLSAFCRYSDWHRMLRSVCIWRRYLFKLRDRVKVRRRFQPRRGDVPMPTYCVRELEAAERFILGEVQREAFPREHHLLHQLRRYPQTPSEVRERKAMLSQQSNLYRLDVYLDDDDDLIHVGGRLRRADLPPEQRHPRLLPKKHHVTRLLIEYHHSLAQHPGRQATLSALRCSGYWIVHGRQAVDSYTAKCVVCRRLRGHTETQKMSDLPVERTDESPPFTHSGVDFCGPFTVKEGRAYRKRWICAFTCFASRAAHFEVAHFLTTSSFLNAYRRFVARRGPVRTLQCDRGTNFVGAANELSAALSEMDDGAIQRKLLKSSCDWVVMRFNTPKASHMGGVWERVVRMARTALSTTLHKYGDQMSDEVLQTVVTEAEAMVNSRPIACLDVVDPLSEAPLTPATLLTTKRANLKPPPGRFVKDDIYGVRYWRRVQFIAQEFWKTWRQEFLPKLQPRGKWEREARELKLDDIVVMVDESQPRMSWPLGRVITLLPSEDGRVRKVRLRTATTELERPVHKLIVLYRED